MLIFEINGNQHYDLDSMQLKPYYQERHDIISALGWTIVEIPYNQSYNEDFRMRVCRQLDAKLSSKQSSESAWEFESPHPYILTLRELQKRKQECKASLEEKKKQLLELRKQKDLLKQKNLQLKIQRLEQNIKRQEEKEKRRQRKVEQARKEGRLSSSGKILGTKVPLEIMEKRKELILNSGIDLNKFGWVGKVEKVTNLSKHQIEDCIKFFNIPSFKRKS